MAARTSRPRSATVFYVNDQRCEVGGDAVFMNISDFLRYELGKPGTKVVCAEGDCGACTVLVATSNELAGGAKSPKFAFKSINSCIQPVFSLDGCQVVTVEGLRQNSLHPAQDRLIKEFGSQCGYCTPGFVCAMAALAEDAALKKKPITAKRAKNYLTGNLCRCTGYDPILKAAIAMNDDVLTENFSTLRARYSKADRIRELRTAVAKPLFVQTETRELYLPTTLRQALAWKKANPQGRVVAGATDLGVQVNKGRERYLRLLSLQNIGGQWTIKAGSSAHEIPARVTLAALQDYVAKNEPELDRMLNIFASPQIKNAGTAVGNLVNGSPIADTIPFLMIADAEVVIESLGKRRLVSVADFYRGYKKLDLKPSEIVTAIRLPRANLGRSQRRLTKLYKVSLRKDLDISAVTMAARFDLEDQVIREVRLAFGGVGPTVSRLRAVEKSWRGQRFTAELFNDLATRIHENVAPISDVRGSKEYRLLLCRNLLKKAAHEWSAEFSPGSLP